MQRESSSGLRVAGLFAGIGGIELGLHRAGHETAFLCEVWQPAREVLAHRFPGVDIHADITTLGSLPDVDVVTAGFPCTDLSQAGRTAGIDGEQSGLVRDVLRLLERADPEWLVVENVRNMLVLGRGAAMEFVTGALEQLGFRWAYRVVDSRFTGVPQRRQRVLLVASRRHDPRGVLFADDAGEPDEDRYASDAYGFYWTEGLRGLGWARDAVPTLKGGSTIGIPSPPAVWVPDASPGRRLIVPLIEAAEQMQGFPAGWTEPVSGRRTLGARWKLVGNAVTVDAARWLGERLATPGTAVDLGEPIERGSSWPLAAWGDRSVRHRVEVSMWPIIAPYQHLLDLVDRDRSPALSTRAANGFVARLDRGRLRFDERFRDDAEAHAAEVAA